MSPPARGLPPRLDLRRWSPAPAILVPTRPAQPEPEPERWEADLVTVIRVRQTPEGLWRVQVNGAAEAPCEHTQRRRAMAQARGVALDHRPARVLLVAASGAVAEVYEFP